MTDTRVLAKSKEMAEKVKKLKVAPKQNNKGELQLTGRASSYTLEIGNAICEQIANGVSLRKICMAETMPGASSVFRWLNENVSFREQYARAKEEQAETLAEEIIEIADDSANDTYIDDNGNVRTDNEVVARSRLKVEARKWVASKLKPHKYGDSINLNHSGKVDLTNEQLESKLAQLFRKAGITGADGVEEIPGGSTKD